MTPPPDVLQGLEAICRALPEAEFYLMHDHPSYRAGKKPFVIAGGESLAVKVRLEEQPFFLENPRFFRTPYIGQHGWVSLRLTPSRDWDEIRRLVVASYRLVAAKRMLKALDA